MNSNRFLEKHCGTTRTFLFFVVVTMMVMMMMMGFSSFATSNVKEGDDVSLIGDYFAADHLSKCRDELSITPTAPDENNPHLLTTKDDDQFVDIKAHYSYFGSFDVKKTTWKFKYTVYNRTSDEMPWRVATEAEIVIKESKYDFWIIDKVFYHGEGEGYLLPLEEVEFYESGMMHYKVHFEAWMDNTAGEHYYQEDGGYGYTDPGVSNP